MVVVTKEEQFFTALKNIFLGAPVEGESGYTNLMRFKARYFEEVVVPELKREVEEAVRPFPSFREELYDKLSAFFSHYSAGGGSLGFFAPYSQSVSERVCTDDRDVLLFWKTARLYYVKSDRLFRSMEVTVDGFRFFFDASRLEHKKANEKRELSFSFAGRRGDGTLVFTVSYAEGKKADPRYALKQALGRVGSAGPVPPEGTLRRAFRIFARQREVDFFICKDAAPFLREQFDLWLARDVLAALEERGTKARLARLKILRRVGSRVIGCLSRFEDELVRIWNKPKFALRSGYVVTLDRISGRDAGLLERLSAHPGFPEQVAEWRALGLVGGDFKPEALWEAGPQGRCLRRHYSFLPLDTRYFKDVELQILELFEDLDGALDGWLIKSENYQALNTILPKFRERVQTIYIDPPFNRGQEAGYRYAVRYRDAAWVTLLENRLVRAREFLRDTGSIFVRCDCNGNMLVRMLMDEVFGKENFKNEIVLSRSGIQKGAKNKFLVATESLFFYGKTAKAKLRELYEPRETGWLPFVHYPGSRRRNRERFVFGCRLLPPPGRHWGISQELTEAWVARRWVRFRCKGCGYEHYEGSWCGCPRCGGAEFVPEVKNPPRKVDSNWTDIQSYAQDPSFPTRNAEHLLRRVIAATSEPGDIVMDFFLGSGTTAAAAHKMGRRWIGVEVGEHFWTVVLPRMKRVLAGERSGISREVRWRGGGFFKYYELEQYEDTLRRARYGGEELPFGPGGNPCEYLFLRDLKPAGGPEEGRVEARLDKLYDDIDLAETLSNLTGRWIRRLHPDPGDPARLGAVEFGDGERVDLRELDWRLVRPLVWW